MTVEVLPMSI